jgi:hypothetical protein
MRPHLFLNCCNRRIMHTLASTVFTQHTHAFARIPCRVMTDKKIPLHPPLKKGGEEMDCRANQGSARNDTEDEGVSLLCLLLFLLTMSVCLFNIGPYDPTAT